MTCSKLLQLLYRKNASKNRSSKTLAETCLHFWICCRAQWELQSWCGSTIKFPVGKPAFWAWNLDDPVWVSLCSKRHSPLIPSSHTLILANFYVFGKNFNWSKIHNIISGFLASRRFESCTYREKLTMWPCIRNGIHISHILSDQKCSPWKVVAIRTASTFSRPVASTPSDSSVFAYFLASKSAKNQPLLYLLRIAPRQFTPWHFFSCKSLNLFGFWFSGFVSGRWIVRYFEGFKTGFSVFRNFRLFFEHDLISELFFWIF